MCFDLDSHPPIAPIAGGALDGMPLMLTAADRNRFAAFRARAADPSGAAVVILPDVRGLHPYYEELALRFAENGIDALAIDWFGRTAGPEPRGEGFDHSPHVLQTTGPASPLISRPRSRSCRSPTAIDPRRGRSSRSASAWAVGCRSWPRRWVSTWPE